MVRLLSVHVDLLYFFEVGLSVLLSRGVFLTLQLGFLRLSHLGGDVNIFHVMLVDIYLLFVDLALKLLISLLVNEKRVPVELCLRLSFLNCAERIDWHVCCILGLNRYIFHFVMSYIRASLAATKELLP